jgi:hypothetical protein
MRALQLPVTFVAQARGVVQYSPLAPNVPVIGSIHPAALLRGGAGEMAGGGKQKMNVDAQAMFLFADVEKAAKVAVCSVWSDDVRVVHEPSEVAPEMQAILVEIRDFGLLGLDLEWTCDGSKNALDALGAGADRALITKVGVGYPGRAVSFTWDALMTDYNDRGQEMPAGMGLEDSGLLLLQAALEDESIIKLSHNKQADRAVWEAQVGPIRGRFLDSMLAHHAAFPGIDHDLQQVVSQFLCVPPWKVEHSRAVKEHLAAEKEQAKAAKAEEKERAKAERKAEHDRKNAEKKAAAEARKAERIAKHEAKNRGAKKRMEPPEVPAAQLPLRGV